MNSTVPLAPSAVNVANVEAARRRRARMQEEERRSKLARQLVTPEGAAIQLKLATAAELSLIHI